MDRNVGGFDRTARLVVGVVLVLASAAAFAGVWAGVVVGLTLFLAGAILVLTGTTRKCPVNRVAGIDTAR
ncbi:YgaP family membrane protein [Halobacterium wangiae]|uniref:YgaP family membrane protein n=1 Tax=Halobacterium wangiae TaxID=2902623 RepID=UPI001E4D920A|nr:DUF2892 domain-containing protein [Halobacterium wangiae]